MRAEWLQKVLELGDKHTRGCLVTLDKLCTQAEKESFELICYSYENSYEFIYTNGSLDEVTLNAAWNQELDYTRKTRQCEFTLAEVRKKARYIKCIPNYEAESLLVENRLGYTPQCVERKLEEWIIDQRNNKINDEKRRSHAPYHNFTYATLTVEEKKILLNNGGHVLQIESPDYAGLFKETVENILFDYVKILSNCRYNLHKNKAPTIKGRTRREIRRYLALPKFEMKERNFIYYALKLLDSLLLKDNFSVTDKKLANESNIMGSLESIDKLKARSDVIIRESDKKLGWSINSVSWYKAEYDRQLSTDNYQYLGDTSNIHSIIEKFEGDIKQFSIDKRLTCQERLIINGFRSRKVQIPFMNLMPKVHKLNEKARPELEQNLKGRPIITAHSWCTVELSKVLQSKLRDLLSRFKTYMSSLTLPVTIIDSSSAVLKEVEDIKVTSSESYWFICFDFKDLYTNILYESVEFSISGIFAALSLPINERDLILNMYKLYNNYNYFQVG